MSDRAAGRPRILNVVTQLEPGGAQTVAFSLHRELVRRSIPSALLFLYEKSPEHFQVRDFASCAARRPSTPRELIAMFAQLRRRWRAFRPTTVFAHTHYASAACAIVKATGAPGSLVAVHHNPVGSYPGPARAILSLAELLGLYDGNVAISSSVRRTLDGLARAVSRRFTIVNGFDLRRSDLSKVQAREAFGLPETGFLIGSVGRLHSQKNQAFLIGLLPHLPDANVVLVGEGELRIELERQARDGGVGDRVRFLGTLPHARIPDFLTAIDVFAMPSLYEGLSIAMLEALGAGVPFIGSDLDSIADIVAPPDKEAAGVVAPLDPERWVDELRRLNTDADWKQTLAARSRSRASDFTTDTMTDAYLALTAAIRSRVG